MNKPKRQHYIPEMILKRFSDSRGWLYCCGRIGVKTRSWKTIPKNVFLETHLYTQYDDNEKSDGSIEVYFSQLEGSVSPIVDKIVNWSLRGEAPHLDADEKDLWLQFLIHQRRRMPNLRPLVNERITNIIGEIPDAYEAYIGREITPQEQSLIQSPDFLRTEQRNAFSGFAAAKPRDDILKMTQNTSIITGVIRNQKKSFVIGNHAIATFLDWFPVHQKVAVRLASPVGFDELKVFDNTSDVRRINEGIARKSTILAGPSRQLVDSLACPR